MPIHNISHNNTLASGLVLPWVPGRYYLLPNAGVPSTNAALGVGTLRAAPVYVPNAVALTKIGSEITVIGDAGSKLRLGIYADDGTGRPGSLILDAGTIAGDSATVQEIAITQSLGPGWYWFAGVVQVVTTTQPTVRVINNNGYSNILDAGTALPAAGVSVIGYSHNGSIAGALPATFSSLGTLGAVPRVFVKT